MGQNLRDHPSTFIPFSTSLELADINTPSIQVGMRYTTPNSTHRNDMQMSPILMTSEHRPSNVDLSEDGTYTGFSVALQKALSAGTLRLASADPNRQPVLNYDYLSDPWDRERMRSAVRLCVEISKSPEYENILIERLTPSDEELQDDDALDRWMLANVGTQHHSSGTCKMGDASDEMAVVDQYCRVHGIEGLRVVDGLHHARRSAREHQRHDHHDCRARGGLDKRRSVNLYRRRVGGNQAKPMKINLTLVAALALIAISILVAFYMIVESSNRDLTSLETTLFQVVVMVVGLSGSFIFGRLTAAESARETARLHARHAFRRVLELYDSLDSLSVRIRIYRRRRRSGDLAVIHAIVYEQMAIVLSTIEDWRDIIPEDVEELME